MFLLALATPVILCITLFAPAYLTVLGADYLVYRFSDEAAAQAILERKWDVFYIIDVYTKLLNYWLVNMDTLGLLHYALPIIALPMTGLIVSLFLTRRIGGKIFNAFHMSASIH